MCRLNNIDDFKKSKRESLREKYSKKQQFHLNMYEYLVYSFLSCIFAGN